MARQKQNDGAYIRKGPWTAEEDEVLISHVKRNGPRDWSSIRSKGLLPRTGKSCRLRWVNKLRPNLKTGCKFSAEEERMVIQLQAQFGNKWAKIATYLQGRTDNDVKNFWSTRRKRFERILQKSTFSNSPRNKGKSLVAFFSNFQDNLFKLTIVNSQVSSHPSNSFLNSEELGIVDLPDLVKANQLLKVEAEQQPMLEATPINMIPSSDFPPHLSLSQLPQPQLDLSFLSGCKEIHQDPIVLNLLDMFGEEIPPLGLEENAQGNKLGELKDLSTPDIFFDEFPPEMLDYLETLTSSSEL
ncbi:transcription factor DUO1-like [Pyrus x bretschneideri]|uniref:transcription factor DUO1-like n=1 Tax=Pyrus x bretschneideri TaxID=225117 RepID=UPI002030B9BA|nr:transcription factor DUO1-like [Pyrus x bretschneideri]